MDIIVDIKAAQRDERVINLIRNIFPGYTVVGMPRPTNRIFYANPDDATCNPVVAVAVDSTAFTLTIKHQSVNDIVRIEIFGDFKYVQSIYSNNQALLSWSEHYDKDLGFVVMPNISDLIPETDEYAAVLAHNVLSRFVEAFPADARLDEADSEVARRIATPPQKPAIQYM